MPGDKAARLPCTAVKPYLCCLLAACGLAASPQPFAQGPGFVCENNSLSRSVEVVVEAGYACRVRYTRGGAVSYPWSARNESGYCAPKALSLVEKLRGWGWQCDSTEEVREILRAHIERFHRHVKILANVGKTCHFYPAEVEFGNLCGDERPEGVVVYTCEADEGDWQQHLAVFLELDGEPLIREVGDSRSRQVTAYHIEDRRLLLETLPMTDTGNPPATGAAAIQCRPASDSSWELFEPKNRDDGAGDAHEPAAPVMAITR